MPSLQIIVNQKNITNLGQWLSVFDTIYVLIWINMTRSQSEKHRCKKDYMLDMRYRQIKYCLFTAKIFPRSPKVMDYAASLSDGVILTSFFWLFLIIPTY